MAPDGAAPAGTGVAINCGAAWAGVVRAGGTDGGRQATALEFVRRRQTGQVSNVRNRSLRRRQVGREPNVRNHSRLRVDDP